MNALVPTHACLLLSCRFLRSILSVKDEFYHRHIIQHNLFTPVFEAFRANPVGDNLVSSAIVEVSPSMHSLNGSVGRPRLLTQSLVSLFQMCDFIHNQNIKSLIEYIVTKHLSVSSPSSVTDRPSLEDVATPYVQTLTILRRTYEEDLRNAKEQASEPDGREQSKGSGSYYDHARTGMSEKALEDQVRTTWVDASCLMTVLFSSPNVRISRACSANFERWTKKSHTLIVMMARTK